jgi:hypothetical protein
MCTSAFGWSNPRAGSAGQPRWRPGRPRTPARFCAQHEPGSHFDGDFGTAVRWSSGFELGVALGVKGVHLKASFNGSARTGYDANAVMDFHFHHKGFLWALTGRRLPLRAAFRLSGSIAAVRRTVLWAASASCQREPALLADREELLADLRARLADRGRGGPRIAALFGLGNAGTTSVAVEYAHWYQAGCEVVWLLPAEDPATLAAEFAWLAALLMLAGRDPLALERAFAVRTAGGDNDAAGKRPESPRRRHAFQQVEERHTPVPDLSRRDRALMARIVSGCSACLVAH